MEGKYTTLFKKGVNHCQPMFNLFTFARVKIVFAS